MEMQGSNRTHPFLFKQIDFKLLSMQFVIIVVISAMLSAFGVFFLLALPLMLLFSPHLWYLFFGWIPKVVLKIGNSRIGSLLSLIPFINFKGQWLLEVNSETVDLNSWGDLKKFLGEYFSEFALINTGVFFFLYRIDTIGGVDFSSLNIQTRPFLTLLLANFLGMIYLIVKSIEDTELKILDTSDDNRVFGLIDLSYSIKSFFVLYFGFSIITSPGFSRGPVFEQYLSELIAIIIFYLGIPFFMSFLYYKSPYHRYIVNSLRIYLLENAEQYDLTVGKVEFSTLHCNHCGNLQQYPNYYCINCGKDMQILQSTIFDRPVTIGSMVYEDLTATFDEEVISDLKASQANPWQTSGFRKLFLAIFGIIAGYAGILGLLYILSGN